MELLGIRVNLLHFFFLPGLRYREAPIKNPILQKRFDLLSMCIEKKCLFFLIHNILVVLFLYAFSMILADFLIREVKMKLFQVDPNLKH